MLSKALHRSPHVMRAASWRQPLCFSRQQGARWSQRRNRVSDTSLREIERSANDAPHDIEAQLRFYKAMAERDPAIVVYRFQTGRFAADERVRALYRSSARRVGFRVDPPAAPGGGSGAFSGRQQLLEQWGSSGGGGGEGAALPVRLVEARGALLLKMIPSLLLLGALYYFYARSSGGGASINPFGSSSGSRYKAEDKHKTIRFSDVKGCDEAKTELQEVVSFLQHPERFSRLGGRMTRGVLLVGPPGTGKTMLARAVAGEAEVPFLFASGSEFEEMFVGVGASRVRELFKEARRVAPCIVFIDEVDAVASRRSGSSDRPYLRMTLNELLVQLDGFEQTDGIIVMAATNFPEALDGAVTRAGRFDKHVQVPLPDVGGRKAILGHYASKVPMAPNVDLGIVARGTPGMSGADLANLVNSAAVKAAADGLDAVTNLYLDRAKENIYMGSERRSAVLSDLVRKTTAYHEGGHALVALLTPQAHPVHKATIIPRGQALGYVLQIPEEDQVQMSRAQAIAEMEVCMGGRVAEELVFGKENITSGASSDLAKATSIATRMVEEWGMVEDVGVVQIKDATVSAKTREKADSAVHKLVSDAYESARVKLTSNRAVLDLLASELLEHETLDSTKLQEIVFPSKKPA